MKNCGRKLFRQRGAAHRNKELKQERGVYEVEFGTYLQYLLPATNLKSRVPCRATYKRLKTTWQNSLADQPKESQSRIWNYQTVSCSSADLSSDGPADNFRNFGTPGALKVCSVQSEHLHIDYAWNEQRYILYIVGSFVHLPCSGHHWPEHGKSYRTMPRSIGIPLGCC